MAALVIAFWLLSCHKVGQRTAVRYFRGNSYGHVAADRVELRQRRQMTDCVIAFNGAEDLLPDKPLEPLAVEAWMIHRYGVLERAL